MSLANVGWSGYKIGQQGANVGQAMNQWQAGDAKGATETAGVKLSITYGSQRSRSSTEVQQTETSGSQVRAQNTVTILATGAGADSDITVIGSDIAGKKGTTLIADDAITLQAAEQITKERSKNSSSGGKIGVSIGYENGSAAFGITVGANVGKGKGVGDEVRYINTSDDLGGIVAESLKQSFSERIDRLVTEYERAGASGSFNAGVEAGKLFVDVAPWITGGVGIARNAVVLTEKIAAKAIAKKAATAVEAGKKDLPEPKPAHSYVRLTEQQRLDKNNELFDNFTGGSNRIKIAQITIDGQIYKANKDFSKNAAVFDNVSQGKVIEYFKDLTGEAFLPKARPMPRTTDIYGNPGIRYTVEKNGMSYTLRNGSSSNDLTGAKWTVEINGIPRTEINGRILKRDSIEIKFR